MKRCPSCKQTKDLSEFYFSQATGRPSSYCKLCHGEKRIQWGKDNPRTPEQHRQYTLTSRYGLSKEEQDDLPTQCGICGSKQNLHVDHDHGTGSFRGMLCRNHNIGLGYFNDDPTELLQAVGYLERCRQREEGL